MKDQNSKRTTERKRTKKTVGKPTKTVGKPTKTVGKSAKTVGKSARPDVKRSRPAMAAASRRKSETVTALTPESRGTKRDPFTIVGIGASAGGLEALEQFLQHVPERSGMAFAIVQHLDPTHKGMLVELLQRATAMPVIQVKDRLKVEPNRVYVIPPNKDMSILNGILHLFPRPIGLNLPIDFFFRSLADDQHERSVGVVLSGMGSDGTLGLRSIREKAGAGFVQDPASAKFDSMPRNAINAGVADVVAPVNELPGKIIAFRRRSPQNGLPDIPPEGMTQNALEKVFLLLRTQTGHDFSLYKKSTIFRRVERRMSLHQIDKLMTYVQFLRENPAETELLFKELLIGVTAFFRDAAAWKQLESELIPALLSAQPKGGVLRAWVPGCSTGEEAYSLAIVFMEALERLKPAKNVTLQIFATDLDREAVDKARPSVYPSNIAADVSQERLRRFFVPTEHGYRIGKEIREMVIFAPQNIIMDPPFTKLDVLACRNLLIYLSAELQKKLIPLFHYCLNPNGLLFLGSAETIGAFSDLFSSLDGKGHFYRRKEISAGAAPVDFPASFTPYTRGAAGEPKDEPSGTNHVPNLQTLADRVILQRLSPPVVFTNDKGDIVYISGRTGKYLEPAAGKTNVNVLAMAREGLRHELAAAFSAALRGEHPVSVRGVQVGTNGGTQTIDLTIHKLTEPNKLLGSMMIVFADVARAAVPAARGKAHGSSATTARLVELERALQVAQEELQTSRERMQTWQEELQSTNEEFQSTNEELQSTNEELTTSKEEMQSMNEELQTVNSELQAKVDELSRSSSDMKNLLNSTDIATLFLDGELRVGRYTPQAAKIIKLIPADVGRPFTDIATTLDYPELADDAREVLRTLIFREKMVIASGNRWFSVRIMPYSTLDNVIDGLVITFTDASVSKNLEAALRKEETALRELADSLPQLVFSSRADGAMDYLSRQWFEFTGVPEPEQLGDGWLHQVSHDDRQRVLTDWRAAVRAGAAFDSEFRLRSADGAYHWFKTRASPMRDAQGRVLKWYGTCTDINDLRPERGETAPVNDKTQTKGKTT
jgi:two-component system CheB/CheR fusion protein